MRYLLPFIILGVLHSFAFAQESISVSGRFKSENRIINVSKEAQRLLFIKTKGNLIVPERGFFLMLSPESAKALGQKYIIIIPLDGNRKSEFYTSSKQDLSFKVQQLHLDEPSVFYTVDNDFSSKETIKKDFFTHPTTTDVLQWEMIINYDYISHVKEWIEALDSNESVMVESRIYKSKMYYDKSVGEESTTSDPKHTPSKPQTTKHLEPLREIARYRLHAVDSLFSLDAKEWSKEQWLAWYDKTMKIEPSSYTKCNPKTYNKETYYHQGFSNSALYATDRASNRVFRLEKIPSSDKFQAQQLLIFDMKDGAYYNYDIDDKQYPYASSFTLFHVENNIVYVITENMRWYRYEYNKTSDTYRITQEVKLLPKEAYEKKKQWRKIWQAYHDGKTMYLLFQDENEAENFILSVDATSGQNIRIKPLKNILIDSKIDTKSKPSFCSIDYAGQFHPDFYFCMANNNKDPLKDTFYLLKTNAQLDVAKSIKISRDEAYGWLMADAKSVYTIDDLEDEVMVQNYDLDLSKKISQKRLPTQGSEGELLVAASTDAVAIYRHKRELISQSVVKYEFDTTLTKELGKHQCVYSHLPVEEITSDTQLDFFYASPIADKEWLVFFKDGNTLRYSQTK